MNDVVQQLLDRMRASERQELLMLLAASIHAMTIVGRTHYDEEDSANQLRQLMNRSTA
jgi:hypothetical protein